MPKTAKLKMQLDSWVSCDVCRSQLTTRRGICRRRIYVNWKAHTSKRKYIIHDGWKYDCIWRM